MKVGDLEEVEDPTERNTYQSKHNFKDLDHCAIPQVVLVVKPKISNESLEL